jgi:gamma-glutamylcyclotransferase (GGCT)/AIG2-like uncharacterized protein YtfP
VTLYFAYGSNLSKASMRERAPTSRPLVAARLPEHRLTFECNEPPGTPQAFFANVQLFAGAVVHGALYSVDPDALAALDRYEDLSRGVYERVQLAVVRPDATTVVAYAYRMNLDGKSARYGRPAESQLRQIREGYTDWGLDLRELEAAMRLIPSTRS